ncbi:MAG: HTH domain-containing protein, partial [Pseudonocardiaceae bacterium]
MTDDRMRAAFALVPDWVDDRVTDGTSMRLYVRLARKYADRQRHAFPGEDVLAEELGCTDRTIRRAIGILGATGALIITRERKADGHFGRNLYYLPTEDPSGTNGRKQTSSGGRKQTSGGRRKQVSGLPEEAGFRSEPDPLNPDPRSNQTSEANASDTDADAPRRASNGDGNPTGADEDPKSGGSKDQN